MDTEYFGAYIFSQKIVWVANFLDPEQIPYTVNIPHIILSYIQACFQRKSFLSLEIWAHNFHDQKHFGTRIFRVQIFGTQDNFRPSIFLSEDYFSPKNIWKR